MATRWHGIEADDDWPGDRMPWWQVVGVLLLVSGVGPIALVQVVWWLVTGERLGA
jgi:hypothetical protein